MAQPQQDVPAAAEAAPAHKPLPELAYHLYFGQFQQLGWLAVALAGGALVMYQVGLFKARPWAAVIAAVIFALAGLISVIGTMELVRGVTEDKDIRKTTKWLAVTTMFLLGAGTGLLVMGLMRTALA